MAIRLPRLRSSRVWLAGNHRGLRLGLGAPVMTVDLKALAKLAQEAAPGGPWWNADAVRGGAPWVFTPKDAAFVAAASPAVVQALVAEVGKLRAALESVCNVGDRSAYIIASAALEAL